MSGMAAKKKEDAVSVGSNAESREYVTLTIAGQWFGIPVLTVQDVLGPPPGRQDPDGRSRDRRLHQPARPDRYRH